MADRLKRVGYPDSDLNVFVPPGHPKDGGLSTPGMGDRLGVRVPWRKRWC
jgi:hypothetical protein